MKHLVEDFLEVHRNDVVGVTEGNKIVDELVKR